MATRGRDQALEVWRVMRPFRAAGYTLMPLTEKCLPRDKGWPSIDYTDFDCVTRLVRGGAIGVRLDPTDLVIDVDPRNGGDESLSQLCSDVGINLDDGVPKVQTGGGGTHLFYKKPPGVLTRANLPAYPGIDFKRCVGFVVAAGSIHAKTGQPYVYSPDAPPPSAAPNAPSELIDLLQQPRRLQSERADSGVISREELAMLLNVVDARRYGQGRYDDWIRISAASHDATDGEGIEEWMEWCWSDPGYADVSAELLEYKWSTFKSGRAGGASYLTLFKAVSKAGRGDLLGKLRMATDDLLVESDVYQVYGADEEDV